MKKMLLACACFGALTWPAFAADPYVDTAYDWSGLYIGAQGSGALADVDWEWELPTIVESASPDTDGSTFGGGVHLGLQKQWGSTVLGVEASYTAFDFDESDEFVFVSGFEREFVAEIDDLFMVDLRLGFAQDRWMGFVKGGYANAEISLDTSRVSDDLHQTSSKEREHGFNVGAGVDYAINDHVIIGADYTYVRLFGDDRSDVELPTTITSNHNDIDADMHIINAKLTFKFGGF